ncbi:MAG: hypothetical protein K0B85_00570 [Coriobacteriia bacterium]|nr:hypothetical protein [Coriobacteriia bacterium]
MMRFLMALALTVAFAASGSGMAHAGLSGDAMSPAEVVAIDRARDGSVIVVEGEAIGEHLRARGGGRWVNILGDETGLGIWVTDAMAEGIEYFGDHRHDGDIVRVVGVVNIACDQHAGEFDVHAESLATIAVGGPREMEIQPIKGVVGAAGMVLAFLLWRYYRQRRERRML